MAAVIGKRFEENHAGKPFRNQIFEVCASFAHGQVLNAKPDLAHGHGADEQGVRGCTAKPLLHFWVRASFANSEMTLVSIK
jgi:hypothetical protein